MFGIKIPEFITIDKLKKALIEAKIFVSFRGDYIRVSCHLFNTKGHFEKLVNVVESVVQNK